MREYALYKGDLLLAMGNIQEIAEKMGVKERTILYYGYPVYKKRNSDEKSRRLVRLDD